MLHFKSTPMNPIVPNTGSPPLEYSFLLVNFNMAQLVCRLVANLSQAVKPGDPFEILIADNSTDPASRLLPADADALPHTRIIPLAENRGLVDALNRLIPLARGKYVMILHPDVELATGCLTALTAFLNEHPNAGVVSPDLYYPNGDPCKIRLRFPNLAVESRRLFNTISYILTRRKFFVEEPVWDRTGDTATDMVMSVCMLFRHEALLATGGITPRLTFYYANDYLCHRLGQSGWTCHYVVAARCIHFERFAPREMYSQDRVMEYKQSTVAANPRMRADYFAFLSQQRSMLPRLRFRLLALMQDSILLLAQLKRIGKPGAGIKTLITPILVDLGIKR